ncbi:hypothetical protein ACP4OV_030691 [Aristida adscensionis]
MNTREVPLDTDSEAGCFGEEKDKDSSKEDTIIPRIEKSSKVDTREVPLAIDTIIPKSEKSNEIDIRNVPLAIVSGTELGCFGEEKDNKDLSKEDTIIPRSEKSSNMDTREGPLAIAGDSQVGCFGEEKDKDLSKEDTIIPRSEKSSNIDTREVPLAVVGDSQVGSFGEEKDKDLTKEDTILPRSENSSEMNKMEVPATIVADNQVGCFAEEKDKDLSKVVEKKPSQPSIAIKRKFEGMEILKNVVQTENIGAAKRTRSHFKSSSQYKDPNLGMATCAIDISDTEDESGDETSEENSSKDSNESNPHPEFGKLLVTKTTDEHVDATESGHHRVKAIIYLFKNSISL